MHIYSPMSLPLSSQDTRKSFDVKKTLNFDSDDESRDSGFESDDDTKCFLDSDFSTTPKRPCPWETCRPTQKRRKSSAAYDLEEIDSKFRNETEAKASNEYERQILPTVCGKHLDLKTVTAETVSQLLNGGYSDVVDTYTIVDCRYPYEYEAGHVEGAINIWQREDVVRRLLNAHNGADPKRNVLIFHCEFSSERGPKMMRFLREMDRELNKEQYPRLCYPEVYLLEGGYKAFFAGHKNLCQPQQYKLMLDKNHVEELKYFRSKSKASRKVNMKRLIHKTASLASPLPTRRRRSIRV